MSRLQEQQGAFAPFAAILIILLILAVGLVVDLGHIHNVRIELQRAVDAAALAGAGQLDGASDQETRAEDAAEAVAQENNVDSEPISVEDDNVITALGFWDDEALGASSDERFDGEGTPVNAVKVEAARTVDHWFFFLPPGETTVTADAIAVNVFEEETIPIALVSCIPTGGDSLNVGSPGLSICDVATYEFNSDVEDTAAWTSLTFSPASNPQIQQFLTEEGRELFNEVVYGTNSSPPHLGLEQTEIVDETETVPEDYDDDTVGCTSNDGTIINCGLGPDISSDPESITGIRRVDPMYITPAPDDDPLKNYEDGLPRWYHFTTDPSSLYDSEFDAFTRLWTMNGHLVKASGETEAEYRERLGNLYNETIDPLDPTKYRPYGPLDRRFKSFIEPDGSSYKANFTEVLDYAGYPPVWVNNGVIPPALDTFLERIANDDTNLFRTGLSSENEPFDSGGATGFTVKLTIPVIFAGPCDEWQALSTGPSQNDLTLYYIGTANFLVTRAWKNPDCFDHGTNSVTVTAFPSGPSGCSAGDFDPPLAAGDTFQCVGGPGANPNAGLEGLIRPPTRGEEAETGIRKVYLVE